MKSVETEKDIPTNVMTATTETETAAPQAAKSSKTTHAEEARLLHLTTALSTTQLNSPS